MKGAVEDERRTLLDATLARVAPADAAACQAAQEALDGKTKPPGSLGEIERLAGRVAGIRGTPAPGRLESALVLAAGDHGVAAERVSAYPQEVTRRMLEVFASGRAAVSVLARAADARLLVVDAGVLEPVSHPQIRALRIGAGTANITYGPAMTAEQALEAVTGGIGLADELAADGVGLVAVGEMGIANTTSASALSAALLPAAPEAVCGRGTGLDDEGLARKIAVVRRALAVNEPDPGDPLAVLSSLGGFEIGVLVGVTLGAAARRLPVVLDGFITAAAALVAARMAPSAVDTMIASHLSPEPGHALILRTLGLSPLLDLGLRLGEGSGAALALPVIGAALALLADMASLEEAGIRGAGP
ncbi:MAG: nicotinate-nucleotide--dimethylbenzimidazole phosphoribosyltransferase [Gaiellaceae bacterium]